MARKSVIQAAAEALGAYLTTALAPDVKVHDSWPEPDQKLRKAVTITSVGARQVEFDAGEHATVISIADTAPPDATLKVYTYSVAVVRQSFQVDIWATSQVACDDLLERLDDALRAGLGPTLGHANANPFRDGCLVALNPASGHQGFADFLFDGQDDDQTPARAGRDEWRATLRGDCSVNVTKTRTLPRLKSLQIRLKTIEAADPGETDVFTQNPDGSYTHTVTVP